jgi:hypothetical protein
MPATRAEACRPSSAWWEKSQSESTQSIHVRGLLNEQSSPRTHGHCGEKLRQFHALADEVIALRQEIQRTLDEQGTGFRDTLRNRIDRFLLDAREKRSECSHHLKTMVECFICSGWVSGEAGETRAKLLCAEMFRSKAAYYELNGDDQQAAEWPDVENAGESGLASENLAELLMRCANSE